MLKNMKLKSRMLLNYGIVVLIVLIALGFGVTGLILSSNAFSSFDELSQKSELAYDIQYELTESQLAYKHFLTSSNPIAITEFNAHITNMSSDTKRLKEGTSDQMLGESIQSINDYISAYEDGFRKIEKLDAEMTTYYNSIADKGYDMLDSLEYIAEDSYNKSYTYLHKLSTDALTHLLTARLRASKYFDFHLKSEYDAYLISFNLFLDDVEKIASNEHMDMYTEEKIILTNMDTEYKAEMAILKDKVEEMDRLTELLDETGPMITAEANSIIQVVNDEKVSQLSDITRKTGIWSVEMVIIALFAISVLIFLGLRIMSAMLTPIKSLKDTFENIAEGDQNTDFRLPVDRNDEVGDMSKAFNNFMVKLSDIMEDIRYQNKLKTFESHLFDIAKDENIMKDLGDMILEYSVDFIHGLVGRIYFKDDEDSKFTCASSYGTSSVDADSLEPDVGIAGLAISQKKVTVLNHLDADYLDVETTLGSTAPTHICVIPCVFEDEVNGIIEVGQLEAFNEMDVELLQGMGNVLGNIIHSTQLRAKMRTLLDKTIQQSEELQMQQEELRQSNEELEEQTRALKESEQRLHAQQEELRVSNEELEERSKQLQIQKQELDDKNKAIMTSKDEIMEKAYALEQANKYKSEFLANMSHELRTPLNSILVLSELLAKRDSSKPLTDKEKEFANTINTSGKDLLTLINGVLDLSKVEAGRLDLQIESINLDDLADESHRLFKVVADNKNIDFTASVEMGLDTSIDSDRMRLSQILKNLISNAIKFTHQGGVSLKIRKLTDYEVDMTGFDKNHYIAFSVTDTGIGIDEDKKEIIFEAFKQMDGSTSRNYGGTGLGLTISLEMAELLGGDIYLESEVGKGSEFVLILPKNYTAEKEVSDIDHEEQESLMEVKSNVLAEPELVEDKPDELVIKDTKDQLDIPETSLDKVLLIIEDDEAFADILAIIASEKGYRSVAANTGKEGLRLAQDVEPDAIIMDMGLPDMDGMDVARALEADESTKHIPIHIVSGREQNLDSLAPKSIIGTLKKPVDIKTIYQTLSKLEKINHMGLKKLLVVGHCGGESFDHFKNLGQVDVVKVLDGNAAYEAIEEDDYGCIVLDTKLEDMSGLDFLNDLDKHTKRKLPIIIYTDERVSSEEFDSMNAQTESIILKSDRSKERLVDEVTLFLHNMNAQANQYSGMSQVVEHKALKQKTTDDYLMNKKVLIVDDDERNVYALMHALELYGMDMVVAKDGKSGLERFGEGLYDLILMDIMMPKMDGYEAIKQIRALPEGKNIPIIALTAKAMAEDRQKCIEAGANDYMTKPIEVDKLISLIKVWVD